IRKTIWRLIVICSLEVAPAVLLGSPAAGAYPTTVALPPAEAKAPAAVVGGAVVVAGVLPVLQVTECTLVAGEVGGLARSLGIVAAADGFIQLGMVARDVLLQLLHAVVAIAVTVGIVVAVA